ncbi:MAG: hypothetical protein ACREOA_11215, partial [Candidatus Dormibacteria bacterium]
MKPTGAEARAQAEGRPSDPELADLSEEFFQAMHSSDPFSATMLGVSGFDALVPDPSVRGAEAGSLRFAAIEGRLAAIDPAGMSVGDRVNHEVLAALTWGARTDLEHSLWEANASPAGYVSPQGLL